MIWILLSALAVTPVSAADSTEKVGATGTKVQPPDTLPKSRAPTAIPQRKPKLTEKGRPELRGGSELVLNAGWELAEAPRVEAEGSRLSQPGIDTRAWYDAVVPGTVLTTLIEQGVHPDPYFGLNNLAIPESLNKQDYWYRTEFTLPASFAGRQVWLELKGINYHADVWFNGEHVGQITGAFIRGRFNVTRLAVPSAVNVLAVKVSPTPNPGIPSEQSVAYGPGDNGGTVCLDGPTFMCSEGWDWIPAIRDRCTGLWQDVVLRATGPVSIIDPQVVTRLPLPDTSRADVTVEAEVRNATESAQQGVLTGSFEGVEFAQLVTLSAGESKRVVFTPQEFPQLALQQPRLWWPNGYGQPALYHLQLVFLTGDKAESDRQTLRFGIRQMTYELAAKMPDGNVQRIEYSPTAARGQREPVIDIRRESLVKQDDATVVAVRPGAEQSPALKSVADKGMGPFLVVKVNGQKILCRGGNWGMDDAMKRISRQRLEPYVRMHRDANLTMIRNWAGQSTSEAFYDLCDQYGILVWNDFWMNTEGWNLSPSDHDLFLLNAADTLRRFRNHPSIAIWCGRNEGVPPDPLNVGLDRLIRELDGTRYYQPDSRVVNLRPSGPWANQPLTKYFRELNWGFTTELGASSIPSAEVMRTMMAPADLWPPGDVWAYHDFHSKNGVADALLDAIASRYGKPGDLEDLCRKAQMVNFETYRAMFEGFCSRLWNSSSGVLVWMSHPSWPSVVWQFYTWDYEPNASLFGAKKGCEPVHVQMNHDDGTVSVVNHTFSPLRHVKATAQVFNLDGALQHTQDATLDDAANTCTRAFAIDWPQKLSPAHFVKLRLEDPEGRLLSDNFYWRGLQDQDLTELDSLPKVRLACETSSASAAGNIRVQVTVTNRSASVALMVKLSLRTSETNQRVLPAFYSDNYFSLLPDEARSLVIECAAADLHGQQPKVALSGWNVVPAVTK